MRIGICDDLQSDRNHLTELIEQYFAPRGMRPDILEFESGEELLDGWTPDKLDILFLDVYMGGLSGVDAARRVRASGSDCIIVFTTTSPDHAIDSYEVHASDYLLKPFGRAEVFEALDWCCGVMAEALRELEVISDRERVTIPFKSISYVEVYGRVSVIHTPEGTVSTNRSLAELEEELCDGNFLRCHRSYLVNMSYIKRPENTDFLLLNGEKAPITAASAAKIKQAFYQWSFKRTWEGK